MINIELVCTKSPNPWFTEGRVYTATKRDTLADFEVYTVWDDEHDFDWSVIRNKDGFKMPIGVQFEVAK
ncbi:hypothetical protein vBYenM636_09 [Yersinia phage vB_YenM_636]|nr:hypothetical protein X1_48 [Yersinia phage vB_Yen_X1]QKN86260.1 hypothetical protein vBYenM12_09 [Yersinia phage vB_YenM_12]QKN86351.1 hypothetical protein vBYenM22_09 [Yersinia phage vB_YenM_22]QKN86442.1 hypothetical protein vBYenM25_09 [Yersinia phage vB_YenM_25]QKN86533.1 hypothetical protein vBYenM27_09 [Yersinia phage vB_YenM_27]QKN86624.1 hypothetical protein vBYenM39_09 [Yersinia phage vB_YenM_39]QKN86715.1 hypothetical protein vBYenM126_09 [Yersinia phage vB_YenM_126]QKN86806.1 h